MKSTDNLENMQKVDKNRFLKTWDFWTPFDDPHHGLRFFMPKVRKIWFLV
jgi:hypothetical protein